MQANEEDLSVMNISSQSPFFSALKLHLHPWRVCCDMVSGTMIELNCWGVVIEDTFMDQLLLLPPFLPGMCFSKRLFFLSDIITALSNTADTRCFHAPP